MVKNIAIIDADVVQREKLCKALRQKTYYPITTNDVEGLQAAIVQHNCLAVIIDIDTVDVDNRTIRELTIQYPGAYFFCLSSKRFHPELKDAICYHIYACLKKPLDPDELFYLLRSIDENDAEDPQ